MNWIEQEYIRMREQNQVIQKLNRDLMKRPDKPNEVRKQLADQTKEFNKQNRIKRENKNPVNWWMLPYSTCNNY